MKFRNYCIIVLGDVDGVKDEIVKISENQVRLLKSTGVVIATFSSVATTSELKTYFESYERNFALFELGLDNYAVNIMDENAYKHLFGIYDESGYALAEEMTNKLFKVINSSLSGGTNSTNAIDIETMSNEEQTKLLDQLLDKGVDNWTDYDKIIIEKLTKK